MNRGRSRDSLGATDSETTARSPTRLHPGAALRETLGACLRRADSIEDVLVRQDAVGLPSEARQFGADIVLFDVRAGEYLAIVRALTDELPETPVVALTLSPDVGQVIACADAGFVGWVPRDASLDELLSIICMAQRGETECDARIARSLLDEIRRRRDISARPDPDALLTRRETETLRLIGRGLTNKEIAQELSLSVATVKNHVHSILRKLRLSRRTEARALLSEQPWLIRSA